MPFRPKKPCTWPGCPELVDSGRCDQHRAQTFREQDRQRGNSTQRGYGGAWRRLRLEILRRDEYTCAHAGCWAKATEVDHIRPKEDGGTDDPANLQAMCHTHHAEKTTNERVKRMRGAA